MAPVILYSARHGETTLNAQNRFRGPIDIDLSEKGKRQAVALSVYFAKIPLSQVVHSDRKRTRETADTILKRHPEKPQVKENKALRAWDLGDFAGKPKNKENLKALQKYVDKPELVVPGGESLSEFRARVRPLIESIIKSAAKSGVPALIVVHSSIIHELGMMFHQDHGAALVKPGGIAIVALKGGKLVAEPVLHAETKKAEGGEGIS